MSKLAKIEMVFRNGLKGIIPDTKENELPDFRYSVNCNKYK